MANAEGAKGIPVKEPVTERDVIAASFVAFILGVCVTATILIGSPIPLKCFQAGSASDWVAAVGTWAIGIGAIYYAYQSHLQRITEVRAERIRLASSKNAHLAAAKATVMDAATMIPVVQTFLDRPPPEKTLRRLDSLITAIERDSYNVTLSAESIAALPHEALMVFQTIKLRLAFMRQLAANGRAELARRDNAVAGALANAGDDALVSSMLDQAKELHLLCEDFIRQADSEFESIE